MASSTGGPCAGCPRRRLRLSAVHSGARRPGTALRVRPASKNSRADQVPLEGSSARATMPRSGWSLRQTGAHGSGQSARPDSCVDNPHPHARYRLRRGERFQEQLSAATLQRHETGCQIIVDRGQVAPAAFDPRFSSARLPVEGLGHGGLRLLLHSHEGYLDNLELLNAAEFPLPESVRVGSDD